jgi:anti-anti-sigma factor
MSASGSSGEVVVTAPAEVDISTAPILGDLLERACASQPERVVVDFSSTTFSDSTAIVILLAKATRLSQHGCELEIRSPDRFLRRVASVLGLSDRLGIPPDPSGAPGPGA